MTASPVAGPPAQPNGVPPLPDNTRKAIHGMFAATLGLEALMVLFVPRAIAPTGSGLGGVRLGILLGLVAVLIVAAASVRKPWGVAFASGLQLAVLACGVMTWAMWILGAVFAGIWGYELKMRHDLIQRWRLVSVARQATEGE